MPNPKKPRTNCLNCGVETKRYGYKYCNNSCQNKHRYNLYIESWLSGGEIGVGMKFGNLSRHIRRFLINRYGNKCSLCGWCKVNTSTGKVPLEVDHIDGDWKNNSLENLRLLCPNCHSLTPTYKARNKGKGRNWRREISSSVIPAENLD